MGVLVAGFGFKTSQNEDGNGFDPISFRLEGSMDGSSWYLLNQKAGYSTPEARGALVGPFMVSKLTALALQGDKTLPASAFPTTVPVPPPVPSAALGVVSTGSMHRPFDRATVSGSLSTQGEHKDIAAVGALRATTITSTLPSAPKVAAAVLDASASVGLDKADAAATVAAVAAVEAVTAAPSTAAARLAQAATAAGLAPEQVEMVTATLQSVDQSHWEAVVEAWTAVAAKKAQAQSAEDKVAAVVSASGEAGLTVAQQAAAAATSANAAAARVAETVAATSPLKMVGEALEGAELQPEGKAAVADAAAKERPDNQEAIAHVLRAAGIMATTTMLPMVDVTDPDARVILEAVVQKLANASVDPQEKVKIANAAAEAYVKGRASTTSVDGVGMIVRAAEALGLAHAQVKRMAETAEQLTVAEQLAAATALRAASEGPDVLGPEDPADKVAAVVKAEAAAGVPEAEQAEAAAAAVTVAAKKAKKAKEAEEEGEILNRIVAEALKIGLDEDQAEAILETVSAMSSEEQAVIERYLISLLSPETVVTTTGDLKTEPVVTTAVSTSTSMTPAAPGSATFRFSVVPSTSSRSSYKAETGLSAKGFVFGVGLDVQGLVEFIESRTGKEVDPFELSLAYGSFLFSWPSTTDCSNKESGFTDFQSITFYNASFSNPGQACGDLLATSMDLDGVLRFPAEGDTDMFRVAGMFGSQYEDSGGDMVTLSILDLLIFQIKASGEKVEYRVCGDSTGASYLGCPSRSPLKIKYPENNLGQGVKICTGQSHFHEYKLENCFSV